MGSTSQSMEGDDLPDQQLGVASPDGKGGGQSYMVEVNCWDFDYPTASISKYSITPNKLSTVANVALDVKDKGLWKFLQYAMNSKTGNFFYDGNANLYFPEPLNEGSDEPLNCSETFSDPLGNDDLTIDYTAKRVSSISASLIADYLEGKSSENRAEMLNALNMLNDLIKWANKNECPFFAKSAIFHRQSVHRCPKNLLDIYRGFSLSFRPQWKCRLNIDMVHRAFFIPENLASVLFSKYRTDMYDPSYWEHIKEEILSLRVEASHYKNGGKFVFAFGIVLISVAVEVIFIGVLRHEVPRYFFVFSQRGYLR
ncbi:Protein argonaute 4B [Taenia solium]|eukprot:TsM_001223600 transcript=TsM_001223600 gene=TsM_001223600